MPKSWRFGPRIEARLPGAPQILLTALRINGKSVRLELDVRHLKPTADPSQAPDSVADGANGSIIDIVRKTSQVVDNEAPSETDRGVDEADTTLTHSVETPQPGEVEVGPDSGSDVEEAKSAQPSKWGGHSGVYFFRATEHRMPPCAPSLKRVPVENLVSFGVSGGGFVLRGTKGKRRKMPRREESMRECAEAGDLADSENLGCFLDGGGGWPGMDEGEMEGIEAEVNRWVAGIGGGKVGRSAAIDFLGGVVGRLRARNEEIGEKAERMAELEKAAWGLVRDSVSVRDGGAEVSVTRKSGDIVEMDFSGLGRVRIVRGTDLRTDKCTEEVEGERVGVRTMTFEDQVTGDVETRKFALIGKDAKILGENNNINLAWLSWEEEYAVRLVRVVLDEVSR